MLTIVVPNGEVSLLGPVPRSLYDISRGLEWSASNTIFIASGVSSGTLVTIAPAGS
jgi:hypothetical protein